MTQKPIIRIHDISTNEITDREMTETEFLQWQKENAENELLQTEQNAKLMARQVALDKLGLTADEAAALFG